MIRFRYVILKRQPYIGDYEQSHNYPKYGEKSQLMISQTGVKQQNSNWNSSFPHRFFVVKHSLCEVEEMQLGGRGFSWVVS